MSDSLADRPRSLIGVCHVIRTALLAIEVFSSLFVWGSCLVTRASAQSSSAGERWAEVTRDANSSTWLDTTSPEEPETGLNLDL
jgi:hypothetical protein